MFDRRVRSLALVGAVAVTAFVGGRLSGLAGTPATAGQPEEMEMEMPPGVSLSPEHEHLSSFLGSWAGTVKIQMVPGQWTEAECTLDRELVLDGRFVVEHVQSEIEGMPFEAWGIIGFNSITKQFENVWIENMATNISFATGSYDAKTKTFSFEGDMLDPMSGEKFRSKSTIDVAKDGVENMTGYRIGADGKAAKNFEAHFEKQN